MVVDDARLIETALGSVTLLTLREAAVELGVGYRTVGRWRNGSRGPLSPASRKALVAYLDALPGRSEEYRAGAIAVIERIEAQLDEIRSLLLEEVESPAATMAREDTQCQRIG